VDWWCTGLRWTGEGPALGWYAQERGERSSPLAVGRALAFRFEGERRCLGVRRGGSRHPCPTGAGVGAAGRSPQCPDCARLDRSYSVAADTIADDPRPYRVYLAWFGPGLLKVGITAEERGAVRLLEQGAVAWSWLGRGPLMAARRTEELLRAALGVPDRIPYARKREVRAQLPPAGERRAEVAAVHGRARALAGWAEALEPLPCEVADHGSAFRLDALQRPAAVLAAPVAGAVVSGVPVGAAGPDLHFADGLVADARLLAGWVLSAADPGAATAAPVQPVRAAQGEQPGLF
jgi:hypothetical protein